MSTEESLGGGAQPGEYGQDDLKSDSPFGDAPSAPRRGGEGEQPGSAADAAAALFGDSAEPKDEEDESEAPAVDADALFNLPDAPKDEDDQQQP